MFHYCILVSRHHFQSSFLSPVTADRIAMTALGLSKPKADSSTSDSLKLGIPPSQVVEAYETHLMNLQGWQEWIDKDEETAQQEKEDKEVPTPKEDIVSLVMSSSNLSEHEKRLLGCIVKPGTCLFIVQRKMADFYDTELLSTTFDDVCTDPKVVDALRDMVSLPLLYPNHFAQGVLARQALGGVLLYGPPGTGKTTLCRALAYECGAQMVVLKPSDIFDQWAGESEKLVSGIFVSIASCFDATIRLFSLIMELVTEIGEASCAMRYLCRRGRYAVCIAVESLGQFGLAC